MKKAQTKTLNSKQRTNKILALLTLLTLAITTIIIGQFLILDYNTNKILHDGTVINGYNLSGMSKDEANVLLVNKFKERSDKFNLTIKSSDNSWNFNKNDFEINSDIHTVLDLSQEREILLNELDNETTLISQFDKIGGSVNIAFNYIFVGLDEKINNIIKEVEIEPINSIITFDPDNDKIFEISESKNGLRVDKAQLYNDINEQFLTSDTIDVELKFIEEIPTVTKEYNESITKKISSFSTNVSDSTGGRKHNVNLALSKFNGFVINPNEQISFNEVTGEQTVDNGYQNATIIYNGEFTDGIGGGICQASSTLYNALLLGGVQIDEVHRHTLPVRYVPLGLDAMVSDYTADLKFTNTSEYPIYIRTYNDKNSVTVELYSHTPDVTYKTRSDKIATIENTGDKIISDTEGKYSGKVLFKGEYFRVKYPQDGYEAKAYLQTYRDGKLIEEHEIRHETYLPQKGIVIEGAKELPAGFTPIDTGVNIIKANEE